MMKKIFIASVFILSLGLAQHVFAASNFVPLAGIPGLTQNVEVSGAGLAGFFNNLYKYLVGLAAALAVIEIIWGGLEYSTQDSVSKKSDGKKRIYQAIFGLVLVLSPVLVFSIINPSILNLSLNLPLLDTKATTSTAPPTTKSVDLSPLELQSRQSQGGSVVSSFTLIDPTHTSARDLGKILDTKQDECTKATSGSGIILPESGVGSGGGAFKYVCQTCPPNTKVVLNPKGIAGSGARGGCAPK